MSKLILQFNPDCMTISDCKTVVQIMRDLIKRRELQHAQMGDNFTMEAESFLNSFDCLTQNMEAS